MKTLIIDHDDMTVQRLSSRLEALGYEVFLETDKNKAVERIAKDNIELVMLDPAPLKSARSITLNIRRHIGEYPYILLMSEEVDQANALDSGANDVLPKPVDFDVLDAKLENAQRLHEIINALGDASKGFSEISGVIPKSAIHQLFVSLLDRADRYAELSYVLFVQVVNFDDISENEQEEAAEFVFSKLAQHLTELRRKSDIIGQSGDDSLVLLMQRPVFESEPKDATARLVEALSSCEDIKSPKNLAADIQVFLVEIPSGQMQATYAL